MRMLFIYNGWNSGTNCAVLKAWEKCFPELEIISVDLADYQKSFFYRIQALFVALTQVGFIEVLANKRNVKDLVKYQKWYALKLERIVFMIQKNYKFDFCFSMQSIVPFSKQQKPLYVFTDLTILANLYYPNGDGRVKMWGDWLEHEKKTFHSARMVFSMSNHVTTSLIEQYGLNPQTVEQVNGGCNVTSVAGLTFENYSNKNILFVGVDWERKGGPELIQAFIMIRDKNPDVTLTIVGCSPALDIKGVKVAGFVPQNVVSNYYSNATVFCLPSWREAFGIVYLEAMQAGLPVVCWNLGAAPDFVINDETGYVVKPGDVDTLADVLESLVLDPEKCSSMGVRGRQKVETHYTWEQTVKKMWKSIEKTM